MATTTASASEAGWSTVITDTNHGALVSITAWLMLVAGLMSLGIRLTIRMPWRKLFGPDDYMTIVATLLAMVHTIAILFAVRHGLGRHIKDVLGSEGHSHLRRMSIAIYIGEIFLVLGITCSKLSVTLLFVRLAGGRKHIRLAWILTGITAALGATATIGVGVSSPFLSIEVPERQEPWPRSWVAISAANVALEIALFLYPIYLVWDLQMGWRAKATVIVGFALRLPQVQNPYLTPFVWTCTADISRTSVIACMRLVSIIGASRAATDISWSYVRSAIYTEIEVHYSLIAATIPCMHMFLRHFQTGYLSTTADQFGGGDSIQLGTKNGSSYAMYSSNLSSTADQKSTSKKRNTKELVDPGFDFADDFPLAAERDSGIQTQSTGGLREQQQQQQQQQHHPSTCTEGKENVVAEEGWEMRPVGRQGTVTTQVTHSMRVSEESMGSDRSGGCVVKETTVDVRFET